MKTIQFIEVGRNKLSWQAQVQEADEASLVRAIKKKGALVSQSIFCAGGNVYAGFHLVGTYLVLGEEITLTQ